MVVFGGGIKKEKNKFGGLACRRSNAVASCGVAVASCGPLVVVGVFA